MDPDSASPCPQSEAQRVPDAEPHPLSEPWRPIESAPKDGTPILIWQPDKYWKDYSAGKRAPQDDNRYAIGYWRVEWNGGWGNRNSTEVNPTHWMPLPAPPAQGTEARRAETSEAQASSRSDDGPVAKGDAP